MGGRTRFVYTVDPGTADEAVWMAQQGQVQEIAAAMGLACQLSEAEGREGEPYVDLTVSVPDYEVIAWMEATSGCLPTSDVICENSLQVTAIASLGLNALGYLSEELADWEVPHGVGGDAPGDGPSAAPRPTASDLIAEVGDALYAATESLEPIGLDLAYLYPAIAAGTVVEWSEPLTGPDDESDRYTNTVKLLRHLFPPDHAVWRHIRVVPPDGEDRPDTLHGLPSADAGETIMSTEDLEDWLTSQIDAWCEDHGQSPGGEDEDLGDLYRHLDDTNAFEAVGIRAIPDYEGQTLYLVGPGAAWLAATGIEVGFEGETMWFGPVDSLRANVPLGELAAFAGRLRRRADEIASLVGSRGDPSPEGDATTHVAIWAYTDADNDLAVFERTYDYEPTAAEVERDAYLWSHADDGGQPGGIDATALEAWHHALCQPGVVRVIRVA
jgi:hypothetical protein